MVNGNEGKRGEMNVKSLLLTNGSLKIYQDEGFNPSLLEISFDKLQNVTELLS